MGRGRPPSEDSAAVALRGVHGADRPAARDDPATSFERIVQIVGAIVAPITVLTALMFYFGWIRTNALFQHFGIEAPVLGFSNQEYMLRSVDGLYVPLAVLLSVSLAGLWVHGLIVKILAMRRRPKMLRASAGVLALAGLALFGMGVAGVVAPLLFSSYIIIAPLCLGLGVATGAYGRWLWQRLPDSRADRTMQPRWFSVVNLVLVVLLVIVSLFWAATEYATALGRGRAEVFAQGLAARPRVTVYSFDRLFLQAPGVVEKALPEDLHAGYRYRYDGLRLLTEAHDRFFLLPAGWVPARTSTIVLDHNDKIRVEFIPGWGA